MTFALRHHHKNTTRRSAVALAAASLLGPWAIGSASAAACTWLPASGNWSSASSWDCGLVPTGSAADSATILGGRTVTVSDTDASSNFRSIFTLNNAGTLQLDAFGLTLWGGGSTTNTGIINVGGASTAALQVQAGHDINNAGGTINIGSGSVLNQLGSTITGGIVSTTGSGRLVGFNNGSSFLSGVQLNGTLDLAGSQGIERVTGGMTLNGSVNIGSNSIFAPQGNQTIAGSGNVVFADNNGSNRFNVEAGTLVLGSGITIHGNTGVIGNQNFVGGAAALVNNGTIRADVAGGQITLAVSGTVTNNGTLGASNGGTLVLNNSIIGGAGSTIQVGAGSTVLQNGVTLQGTIASSGGGDFRVSNNGGNVLDGASFSGVLNLASAQSAERVTNGLAINGTVNIGNNSVFAPQGDQTISGSASFVFADNNGSNRFNVEAGNLVLGSGVTIRGNTGIIGGQNFAGGASSLVLNGTVQADVAGGQITLAVNGPVTNNGTLAALNGGTLVLNNSVVNTAGSQIHVDPLSTVVQNGVTLNGAINVGGGGSFRPTNNGNNFLDAASYTGVLDLASAQAIERVTHGLTLNGVVNVGNNSAFAPQGDQTIAGSGTFIFADANGSNRFNVEAGNLVLGSGIMIRGNTGIIGNQSFAGGAASLTNNGTIQADVAGGLITLAVSGSVTNNGTFAALNGGTLLLNSSVTNNPGSQIHADALSTVVQNGVTLNGTLIVSGGGSFRPVNSGSNLLDGASFTGVIDLASAQGIERVVNGLTLNGSADIGNNSVVAPQGDQTITGAGSFVFVDNNGSNRFNVEAGSLVLDTGITVRGNTGIIGGQAFLGGASTLTNKGLVSADTAGGTITLAVNGLTRNLGTLQAKSGGTLLLNSTVDSTGGTLLADVGGTVRQNSVSITGGTLNSNGSGRFVATNSGSNFLTGVTLNGVLDMSGGQALERITGGMTLNGSILLGNNSLLAPQGDNTITGNGSIVFADGNGSNRLNVEAGSLVLDTGITVRGNTGTIGGQSFAGGAAMLSNRGTIQADAGGTISVGVTASMSSSGTLRASNGGLLLINTGSNTIETGGVVEALASSTVRIANGASFSNLASSTLSGGIWKANSIGGGSGLIDFVGANTTIATNAADIYLIGASSVIQGRDASNIVQTLDQTLSSNLGSLRLQQGRVFVASANGGNFSNGSGGLLELSDGTFQSNSLALNGTGSTINSFGSSTVSTASAVSGNGQIKVLNGTLSVSQGLNLGVGSVAGIAAGATLNLASAAAASLVDRLNDSGALALGAQNLIVTKDYLNTASGVGNSFDARAGVSGSGVIVGLNASDTVTGNVTANGSNTWLLDLGNVRGGSSRSLSFQIANSGSGADIRGALQTTGLSDARVTGSGASAGNFGPIAAGASSGSYTVTVNASSGGALNGQSLSVVSNFGNVATQVIDLAGFATALAVGSATPSANPVVLGNFRVGAAAPSQAFAVTNTTSGSGAERLGIGSVASTGNFSASNNLGAGFVAPGASFSSAVTAAVSGGVAGVNTGSLTINYSTNGQLIDASFATQAANSQTLALQATGYLVAGGLATPSPVSLAAQRVGGTSTVALTVSNTTVPGLFSEDLNAAFSGMTGAAQASGTVTGRVAGTSNTGSGAMLVGLDTSTSGAKSGTATLSYQTSGAVGGVSNGLAAVGVGTQTIAISGNVYAPAVAQSGTGAVSFGIVRVGDVVAAKTVSVSNVASGALTDTLRATLSGASAPFTAAGTVSGLAAGATNASALTVALNTATAGVYSGSAALGFTSQNPEMSDLALTGTTVTLNAQVNNLAATALAKTAGAGSLSGGAASYTLNFGTLALGTGSSSATLSLSNSAGGPADALSGSFDLSGVLAGNPFTLTGFNSFSALAAGGTLSGLGVSFASSTLGSYDQVVVLNRISTNGSGPDLGLSSIELHLQGSVVAVPEPGTWAMWLGGLALMAGLARRRGIARA